MTSRTISPIEHAFDVRPLVPGSKSFTNRALVVSALASGITELDGVLFADDTEAMLDCLQALGIAVEIDRPARRVRVAGVDGVVPVAHEQLNVRQSGTTARFLPPMLALGSGDYFVDGAAQMRGRPMGDLVDALGHLGVSIAGEGPKGDQLPFRITAAGPVRGGSARLRGDVSSQFLSGLLLSAPYFVDGLDVELTTDLVSKPYVDITLATMGAFGVCPRNESYRRFVVEGGKYTAPGAPYRIEPDATAASYFFGAAALCGGAVEVDGLGEGAVQGDVRFADILGQMGAVVERQGSVLRVSGRDRGGGRLRGVEVNMSDCSDTAQTLAVVAAFADGPTRVTGIGFIRRKETDRIGAVVAELRRCGVDAQEEPDGFVVRPRSGSGAPHGASVQTYDDHRMAMSFSLLGLRVSGVVIEGADCVTKTFPDFFDVLESLR